MSSTVTSSPSTPLAADSTLSKTECETPDLEASPKNVPLVEHLTRRKRRRLLRRSEERSRSTARKLAEVEEARIGEIHIAGNHHRGTRLVNFIPNTNRKFFECISTVGFGVLVERAPHVGWAVKADRCFIKSAFITQYEGCFVTPEEIAEAECDSMTHVFGIGSRFCILGLKTPIPGRGAASFANHSENPNARYYKLDSSVFIRALREIHKGEWITVSYGPRFLRTSGAVIHRTMQ
jgi:SET domain